MAMRSFGKEIRNMMTLQASYFCAGPRHFKTNVSPRKNAAPFASSCRASLTVEAALCLPIFLFFSAALLLPMCCLDRQRKVQTALEAAGEELSLAAYLAELAEKWGEGIGRTGEGTASGGEASQETAAFEAGTEQEEIFAGSRLFSGAAAALLIKGKAGVYADGLIVEKAEVGGKDSMICLEVSWREEIPFFESVGADMRMNAGICRRAWTGYAGKLKTGEDGKAAGEAKEEAMVYVGASMGRYHLYRDCHYISNEYRTASADEVGNLRNSAGKRYKACTRCVQGGTAKGLVYVTPAGEHYHADKTCTAMVSYVRRISLKEAEALGLCSYCRKRKAGG